jgi:hypothetical protein
MRATLMLLLACFFSLAPAQKSSTDASSDEASSTEALQKATQNPVASLISVPLQNNSNFRHWSL